MKKSTGFFIFILSIALLGCDSSQEIKRIEKTYEITEIKRPKRFKVSIKDVETGVVYKMVRVSKRCHAWQKLKIGSKWSFVEVTYQKGSNLYTKVINVNELCNRLKNL